MPTRRSAAPQPDAVSRRLSLLSAELAAVRDRVSVGDGHDPVIVPPHEPELHTRIRSLEVAPDADAGGESALPPPALPTPGRHASRMVGVSVAEQLSRRLPDTMRGRVRLTSAQLVLVALAVAVGVAVAGWWTLRSSTGQPVAAPVAPSAAVVAGLQTPAAAPSSGSAAPATTGATTGASTVVVDVSGSVRRPGIVVLESGSRVVDALAAAGGAKRGVDLSSLNQARLVLDGEQILVGAKAAAGPGMVTTAPAAGGPTSLVNINSATGEQLEELPGVGPVTATAIIDWRTSNGGFTSIEELLEVDGIGDATLADLAPYVTI